MTANTHSISIFGEVLFDHFPDGKKILGGAPFNVAWHLQAFKQRPIFISRVGTDDEGLVIREAMTAWGMEVRFLQLEPAYPTGQVSVHFKNNEPSYKILAQQAYDYIDTPPLNSLDAGGILYHGTLAARATVSQQTLASIKSSHQGKIFIDVNLRPPWWNKSETFQLIREANWLKLNIDELEMLEGSGNSLHACMEAYLLDYALDGIIVTRGQAGAVAADKEGRFFSVAPKLNTPFIDSVGAGDAFSAILLLGLNLDWDFQLTLARAQDFASAITGQHGAIVRDRQFYAPFVHSWGL